MSTTPTLRVKRWITMHTLAPMDERVGRRGYKRRSEYAAEGVVWLLIGRWSSARSCWRTAARMGRG